MESREIRRRTMQAVKGKDTGPELIVRRLAHDMGFRFRLHRKDLSGKPDLVFPRLRKVLFVHGCFWHGHHCARGARVPKTNRDYWNQKIGGNRRRDRRSFAELKALGWRAKVFWECQLKDQQRLRKRLRNFLVKLY
jgi:DNA mismatch endonuclease (patch repair protein)